MKQKLEFLAKEFSLENLVFYLLSQSYEESPASEHRKLQWAQEIFSLFIKEGGVQEVNIPAEIKKQIQNDLNFALERSEKENVQENLHMSINIEEVGPRTSDTDKVEISKIFSVASAHVYFTMENDPLQRFLTTNRSRLSL